ncbi:MAG: type I-U CRISPR-associated helicase/endonuclease Cas3 [Rhodobacteraceae bacterium]|nr:type I-U CRISPR-associated helicase/endonuclease Cas3 [Paracoccaceae bacterium]
MNGTAEAFDTSFKRLTGDSPFAWQRRLFAGWFSQGKIPEALDLPTGLGKTSVMVLWHLAWEAGAALPRRLIYVVDRRAVVDQATREAEKLKKHVPCLRVSTLRGQWVDNQAWREDPAARALVVGTVDMIGSRLLFSGYGVSRGMRPYHAGLLGADTLVVLDESHLVPPFEYLLRAVRDGRHGTRTLAAAHEGEDRIVPPFRLLCLSATGRTEHAGPDGQAVFRLEPGDREEDGIVRQRLDAAKVLRIVDASTVGKISDNDLAGTLAEHAWALSGNGTVSGAYLIYCDSRDVAEKTKAGLDKKAGKHRGRGVETELFVGARRVHERATAEQRLEALGFLAGTTERQVPAFLVATSAGEVGVDLDADHMVCDLVAFERLVQRLGRVNRRGGKHSKIRIITTDGPEPNRESERGAWNIRKNALQLLRELPELPGGSAELAGNGDPGRAFDASPGALLDLKQNARLARVMADGMTPAPLYPALTRPLVDAWSMTALKAHTGRPEVAPWLRGWEEEDIPRTTMVWRTHLPVRTGKDQKPVTKDERDEFFRAAAPHLSERLETETYRVVDWLAARAGAVQKSGKKGPGRVVEPAPPSSPQDDLPPQNALSAKDTVAFILDSSGAVSDAWKPEHWVLKQIERRAKGKDKEEAIKLLAGRTLVVDARLGGLSQDGLLDKTHDAAPVTGDSGALWGPDGSAPDDDGVPANPGFRVYRSTDETPEGVAHSFVMQYNGEGEAEAFLHVETRASEDSRSVTKRGKAQYLENHVARTMQEARKLGDSLALPPDYRHALVLAARLHDEGKRATRWQQAMNAPDSTHVYAKTKGPSRWWELNGYRHEFGSLPYIEADGEFAGMSPDLQDLVLHLVAAHHGHARPQIPVQGCDDAPPTVLDARAREVALRFARLQERWGPWGLAWFETLLRAADQKASRDLDTHVPGGGE